MIKMNETLNLIEEYQFIYDEYESDEAIKNYETCLTYGYNGMTVSANWLFKRLGRPERQKDILPVLLRKGLIATIDIKQLTQSCGVYDYDLSLAAAEKVIVNHDNFYVASDVLTDLRKRYADWRKNLLDSGYTSNL
jgi:hypothetical protein